VTRRWALTVVGRRVALVSERQVDCADLDRPSSTFGHGGPVILNAAQNTGGMYVPVKIPYNVGDVVGQAGIMILRSLSLPRRAVPVVQLVQGGRGSISPDMDEGRVRNLAVARLADRGLQPAIRLSM